MRTALACFLIALLVAAIVKPRGTDPGMRGWVREYASFVQTLVRVGAIGLLVVLGLSMLGLI